MSCISSTTCPGASICYSAPPSSLPESSCQCMTMWAFSGSTCLEPTVYTVGQRVLALLLLIIATLVLAAGVLLLTCVATKSPTNVKNVHGLVMGVSLVAVMTIIAALVLDVYGSYSYVVMYGNPTTKPDTTWIANVHEQGVLCAVAAHITIIAAHLVAAVWSRLAIDAQLLTRYASDKSAKRMFRFRVATAVFTISSCICTFTLWSIIDMHAGFISVAIFTSVSVVVFMVANILIGKVMKPNSTPSTSSKATPATSDTPTKKSRDKDKLLHAVFFRIQLTSYVVCTGLSLVVLGACLFQRVGSIPGFDNVQDLGNRPTVASLYVMYVGELLTCIAFIVYSKVNLQSLGHMRQMMKNGEQQQQMTMRLSSKASKETLSKLV